jgi:hypothetical protein
LSQLSDQPIQPPQPPHSRPQDEAGPSERRKLPHFNQLWHGNLQEDSRAMVILLQVVSVETGSHEITFQGHFKDPMRISIKERIYQVKVVLITIGI